MDNQQKKELLAIGTRVTHFDGGPGTHGKGTIAAYNPNVPSAYVKEKFSDAVAIAAEGGVLGALANSFYHKDVCPYVVRWDPSEKYPKGYRDVYEPESALVLVPMENIFDRHGEVGKHFTTLGRHWHDKLGWTQWEPMTGELHERFKDDPDMEFCIRPLPRPPVGSPHPLLPSFRLTEGRTRNPPSEILVQPLASIEQLQSMDAALRRPKIDLGQFMAEQFKKRSEAKQAILSGQKKDSDTILGQYAYGGLQVLFVCNAEEIVFQVMKSESHSPSSGGNYTLLYSGDDLSKGMQVFEGRVQNAMSRTSRSMVSLFMQ